MGIKPEDVGFADGVTGHQLTHTGNTGSGHWTYERFECTCGAQYTACITKKGTATAGTLRSWLEHVRAINTPDEIYAVGSIQKTRVRWDLFVFPRSYTGAIDFAEGTANSRYYIKNWITAQPNDGWQHSHCWAVGISKTFKSSSSKKIESIYTSRSGAIQRATKMLRLAEDSGDSVTFGEEAHLEAPVISPRLSLMEFVTVIDEALESTKLGVIQDTVNRLNDFMDALPILEAKRLQLTEHHDNVLTLGMDLGLETAEEEAGDPSEAD